MLNNTYYLIVMALATYRISKLITSDKITWKVRDWILTRFPSSDDLYLWKVRDKRYSWFTSKGFPMRTMDQGYGKETFLGNLISCDLCISVWIAPLVYILSTQSAIAVQIIAVMGAVYLLVSHEGDEYG